MSFNRFRSILKIALKERCRNFNGNNPLDFYYNSERHTLLFLHGIFSHIHFGNLPPYQKKVKTRNCTYWVEWDRPAQYRDFCVLSCIKKILSSANCPERIINMMNRRGKRNDCMFSAIEIVRYYSEGKDLRECTPIPIYSIEDIFSQ